MVVTEPGYYLEDEYGIRIENVAVIVPANTAYEKPFLTFETVTLVPVQSKLLDADMLSKEEVNFSDGRRQRPFVAHERLSDRLR